MTDISSSLAALFIHSDKLLHHAPTTSPANWRKTLSGEPSAPASFELIKTLVYKPKTAKSATPVPVIVVARDETDTNSAALAKKLNLKELRLAPDDMLTNMFGLDKNSSNENSLLSTPHRSNCPSVSHLAVTDKNFEKVITVLDASIPASSSVFAVHALSSSISTFQSGTEIASYLTKLQTAGTKIHQIDFKALSSGETATSAPAPSASLEKPATSAADSADPASKVGATKEKEDAKIEGAVQIAIGVKKEVDFAAWYTSVRS
jgi:prolyl-tRNA synthetase